tara:strand:+ start:160 stop:1137 length:978 start_codon:yes stop_codon:yes gene_type:complete
MKRLTKDFHLIWFSDETYEMTYLQYFSIVSILAHCSPRSVNIFTDNGFKGSLWDKVKGEVEVYNIERPEFNSIGSKYNKFVAYSDIARNLIIKEYGGIYCDFDIIWTKPIDHLLQEIEDQSSSLPIYSIGEQGKGGCEGLNMGVIIGEKDNLFCDEYLKYYSMYDQWVKEPSDHIRIYSTTIPSKILNENSKIGTILPYNYFHWPLYHVTKNWFLGGDVHPELEAGPKYNPYGGGYWSNESLESSYAHHCFFLDNRLKDNKIEINAFNEEKKQKDLSIDPNNVRAGQYELYLNKTVEEFINEVDSPFTKICKPLLNYDKTISKTL